MDNQELRADEALTKDQIMDSQVDCNNEENDEDEEGLFDDEEEDDEEAEAVAKRLGDALWADISKAYAQRASEPTLALDHRAPSPTRSEQTDDYQNIVDATRAVLALAVDNPALNDALSSTTVPGTNGQSLLQILIGTTKTTEISSNTAHTLSILVQSIADADLP